MNKKLIGFVLMACSSAGVWASGERVVCHYPQIDGYVGVELVKPNGDHYFDVDIMDFDTAPVRSYGDGLLTGVTGDMADLGIQYSSYKSGYTGCGEEWNEHPSDKSSSSWYHPKGLGYPDNYSGPYHPFVFTPKKTGTYNVVFHFIWPADGHQEDVAVRFVIHSAPKTPDAWYKGAWNGKLTMKDDEAGPNTAQFKCNIAADGSWTSSCAWESRYGTLNVNSRTAKVIPVSDSIVRLQGEYDCGHTYRWFMIAKKTGESYFAAEMDNCTQLVDGYPSKDMNKLPSWAFGRFSGEFTVSNGSSIENYASFVSNVKSDGSWTSRVTFFYDPRTEEYNTLTYGFVKVSESEYRLSGRYVDNGVVFDWKLRIMKSGESIFTASAQGVTCKLSGTCRKISDSAGVYVIRLLPNGGVISTPPLMSCEVGKTYKLPVVDNRTFTAPAGKKLAGWRCSNGKRYDDGMLIFNLANSGGTVTMTAIWE